MWDIEVDVACVGAGIGTLASAILTVDAGAKVLVAAPASASDELSSPIALQQRVGGFLRSWQRSDLDQQTAEYLAAMSEDLDPQAEPRNPRLTMRSVQAMSANVDTIETFVGAHLRTWNAQCLASPYGLLFSNVSGRRTTRMRASDGQTVEVNPIGAIRAEDLGSDSGVTDWIVGRARERGIEVREASHLDRIVFEDGRIIGVLLGTADGPLAVKVRHGLTMAGSAPTIAANPDFGSSTAEEMQVCIVGQAASRFHRIELLTTDTAQEPVRPMCLATGMRLRAPLREPRTLRSAGGSCGKLR